MPGVLKVEPGLVSQVEEQRVPGQKAERVTQVETGPAAVLLMASSFRSKQLFRQPDIELYIAA